LRTSINASTSIIATAGRSSRFPSGQDSLQFPVGGEFNRLFS
jgi:hypothetical protein